MSPAPVYDHEDMESALVDDSFLSPQIQNNRKSGTFTHLFFVFRVIYFLFQPVGGRHEIKKLANKKYESLVLIQTNHF